MTVCLFCKIASGEIPATTVCADAHTVAFRDLHPQAPTHVLVIPRRHIPSFAALGPDDGETVGHMAAMVNRVATAEGLNPGGFRVICNNGPDAGQSVDHIHWHVLGGRTLAWPPG